MPTDTAIPPATTAAIVAPATSRRLRRDIPTRTIPAPIHATRCGVTAPAAPRGVTARYRRDRRERLPAPGIDTMPGDFTIISGYADKRGPEMRRNARAAHRGSAVGGVVRAGRQETVTSL
ncbi:hypothetical protein Areg01_30060 [Actinoplanes regularis]|nr:hypothetical protein Are01nite_37960 [Actinoplanes regularis]GLW30066.1 hypothetical protein Areg01_30060 [Actinoplanes regularis]